MLKSELVAEQMPWVEDLSLRSHYGRRMSSILPLYSEVIKAVELPRNATPRFIYDVLA